DGAAEGSAKLVPYVGRFFLVEGVEVAPRISHCVAMKLKGVAVKCVGPGAGLRGHNAAAASVFGGIDAGQDLELLNGFHRRLHHHGVEGVFVIDDSIDQPSTGTLLRAQGVEIGTCPWIESAVT